MISTWLLPSLVRVLRPRAVMVDGVLESTWVEVAGLTRLNCRIEVNFYRPGKDMPMPIQAGRAPDRVAVYWVAPGTRLQPGDHLECVSGPIIGTWQVRTAPDRAQNMRHLHHLEGQCIEVAPSIASGALSAGES
jgi:hypothetical protein